VGGDDAVQWVDVACFKDAAQRAVERLHKGDRAYVEGRIELQRWTGQDGVERSGLKVTCFKVEPVGQIGRRAQRETDDLGSSRGDARKNWQAPARGPRFDRKVDDEIPF
jgi:single-stranded DNA-binding protein